MTDLEEDLMTEEQLRCRAITKAGSQCKNSAQTGSDYCHVHRNYIEKKAPAVEVDDAEQPGGFVDPLIGYGCNHHPGGRCLRCENRWR